MQQVAMATLSQPNHYDLKFLQNWLARPGIGNHALIGADRYIWGTTEKGSEHASDLIVLKSRPSEDRFTKWVTNRAVIWFHHYFGRRFKKPSDLESGIVCYEDSELLHMASSVTTVVASILPILSTVILCYVQSLGLRLGVITIFTLLFSVCLNTFTEARSLDCFIASTT